MPSSIFDRLGGKLKANRELSEEQQKEVLNQIMKGVQSTGEKVEYYRIYIENAVKKARRAANAGDDMGKQNAMREMKTYYGFFRHMSFLHDAFRAMQSHIQIQAATRDFAEMVECFSRIHVQGKPVDFEKLQKKVLKLFQPVDTAGLNRMVDGLVGHSTTANGSDTEEDAFLEKLVSGEATLDTPYSATVAQAVAQVASTAPEEMTEIMKQITEGLAD